MAQNVTKEEVTLPSDQQGRLAFLLHNVLDRQECEDYIKWSEEVGYLRPRLHSDSSRERGGDTFTRNRDQCLLESRAEAEKIWHRIRPYVPPRWMGAPVMGLSEKLVCLRYNTGQFFKPSADGHYVRDNGQPSQLTVIIYLNRDFEGGQTRLLSQFQHSQGKHKVKDSPPKGGKGGKGASPEVCEITPKTGSALIMQQDLVHEEAVVTKGLKYTLRSDVMYAAGLPMRIRVRHDVGTKV